MKGAIVPIVSSMLLLLSMPTGVGAFATQTTTITSPLTTTRGTPAMPRTAFVQSMPTFSALFAATTDTAAAKDEAAMLLKQAEKMRLEAEKLDMDLTLRKIEALESKLNNAAWMEKHKDQEAILAEQLEELTKHLNGEPTETTVSSSSSSPTANLDLESVSSDDNSNDNKNKNNDDATEYKTFDEAMASLQASADMAFPELAMNLEDAGVADSTTIDKDRPKFPIKGFLDEELAVYIPLAIDIEARMANATAMERLEELRDQPQIQELLQNRLAEVLLKPLQDLQQMEQLKQEYLQSNSQREKDNIRIQVERLEKALMENSPFIETDSYNQKIPPMPQEELNERLAAMGELPVIVQDMFKARQNVKLEGSLELAIQLEHYTAQVDVLDQLKNSQSLDDDARAEAKAGFMSMPENVRKHIIRSFELDEDASLDTIIDAYKGGKVYNRNEIGDILEGVEVTTSTEPEEYGDLGFMERTRFASELIESFTAMEDVRPSEQDVNTFVDEVLGPDTFTLNSKPERVMGGYYIRGINRCRGENANDKMVAQLRENLALSSVADKIQFYYINDPTAQTDEALEGGIEEEPILAITAYNPEQQYKRLPGWKKAAVSASGLFAAMEFSIGSSVLSGPSAARFDQAMAAKDYDLGWLVDMAAPMAGSILLIAAVHEMAHRIVAWKDKFDVGLPNVIPSIQLGLTGTITPIRSPPKNFKSLFDFAVAGPLAGFLVSVGFLLVGLQATASTDLMENVQLPSVPIQLLKSSALGGGLVELFLGNGVLDMPAQSALPLHPFAISGFVGMISNMMALLPIGNTDGGRISVTLFGRRGAYLVRTLSILSICVCGIFGFDDAHILVAYAAFVAFCQTEMEVPVQNEVDELDDIRAGVAIGATILVLLTLLPFT